MTRASIVAARPLPPGYLELGIEPEAGSGSGVYRSCVFKRWPILALRCVALSVCNSLGRICRFQEAGIDRLLLSCYQGPDVTEGIANLAVGTEELRRHLTHRFAPGVDSPVEPGLRVIDV